MMLAWKMYKQTQEFANTLDWAAYSDHRTGSLWAAFSEGWQASIESQAAEIAKLTAERDALRGAWMPLLGTGLALPMGLLNEQQAQRNHGQSLARLAERGGLGPSEALAVAERRQYQHRDFVKALEALVALAARAQENLCKK